MPNSHRDALLHIHQELFPERYPREIQPDHEYWSGGDDAPEFYEWNSGTIEWVAASIETALKGDPDVLA